MKIKKRFSIFRYAAILYLIREDIKDGKKEMALKKIDILLTCLRNNKYILFGVSEKFMRAVPELKKELGVE